VLYTRKLVIYSFMLLQALHIENKMKNLHLKVTLLSLLDSALFCPLDSKKTVSAFPLIIFQWTFECEL